MMAGPMQPDFEALRTARNAEHAVAMEKLRAEGWTVVGGCLHHDPNACYCDCGNGGPCEHTWDGKTYESQDGCEWSATCSRCGMTSMSHSLRFGP